MYFLLLKGTELSLKLFKMFYYFVLIIAFYRNPQYSMNEYKRNGFSL